MFSALVYEYTEQANKSSDIFGVCVWGGGCVCLCTHICQEVEMPANNHRKYHDFESSKLKFY